MENSQYNFNFNAFISRLDVVIQRLFAHLLGVHIYLLTNHTNIRKEKDQNVQIVGLNII